MPLDSHSSSSFRLRPAHGPALNDFPQHWPIVHVGIWASPIGAKVHQMNSAGTDKSQQDDAELHIGAVQAARIWWCADVAVLAIQWSHTMQQISSLFNALGYSALFIIRGWSLQDFILKFSNYSIAVFENHFPNSAIPNPEWVVPLEELHASCQAALCEVQLQSEPSSIWRSSWPVMELFIILITW